MAFHLLGCIGQIQITDAINVLATAVNPSASPALPLRWFGEIGYILELLLGAGTIVMGTIGVLRVNGSKSSIDRKPALEEDAWERDIEVRIRIEAGLLGRLHRHQCIVTLHRPSGGAEDMGRREVWYARE